MISRCSLLCPLSLRSATWQDRLRETKGDIGNLEYKIDVQEQRIKELESSAAADTKQLESKISECEHVIEKAEADIAEYQAAGGYQSQVDELLKKDPAKKAKQFQSVIGKLGNKIERLQKNISFYQRTTTVLLSSGYC